MSDWRHHRGGPPWAGRWRGKGPPPWWPQGEPWPPEGPEAWRRMRRPYLWPLGCFFFILLIVLAVWALTSAIGWLIGAPGGWLVAGGLLLIGLVFFSVAVSGMRRAVRPVGELVAAAERVEAGDFSVRVDERGFRELRSLARAFNAMSERLEANQHERRSLLADVSHELRTPLTVIQGNLEGILDGLYPADEAHLGSILDETRLLERLIEDLRSLSLSEAGVIQLEREPTPLAPLLEETVAAFRAQADGAGVTLEVRPEAGLPTIRVDPGRLRGVVANLLANALRYTPAGGRIEVRAGRATDADGGVEISVRDTGQGIAPDVLPRVFERFSRAADSPGSGLGLAIARNVVEAHGGSMRAESPPGGGTTISFRLPIGH